MELAGRSRRARGQLTGAEPWCYRWQQCLAFLPDPHGHGEFLGTFADLAGSPPPVIIDVVSVQSVPVGIQRT